MPKNKKPQSASSESDSDSGPDDRKPQPPSKKSKPAKSEGGDKGGSGSSMKKNAEGEYEWELEGTKAVKVREFKGKIYVDIREYYEKNGKLLPGKKGIALTVSQWRKLNEIAGEVDDVVSSL
ncbi:RNA polymerase II transcriptional coactivator [Nilaparvata lugens]|uniref:RNA polymerase II transcriptional coactivator n=2 Tax=Nilaparvata lugens TaxID=108931 RepID=UPI00193E12ED|nr:RNA polymerase II transcriptional coactivator [Nilaparvata lugens]